MRHAKLPKTKRQKIDGTPQDSRSGIDAVSITPPAYGVDFVDHGQTTTVVAPAPVQLQDDLEEKELLQGKFATVPPMQFQGSAGPVENSTGMPDLLKSGLEQMGGYDLSDVRVHYNSPKPAQINALAYTQGQDIHLGPRQEKHLPHEGWHAIQQMQGRVRPTMQAKGVSINDDGGLEHEADVMGTQALRLTRSGQVAARSTSSMPTSFKSTASPFSVSTKLSPEPMFQRTSSIPAVSAATSLEGITHTAHEGGSVSPGTFRRGGSTIQRITFTRTASGAMGSLISRADTWADKWTADFNTIVKRLADIASTAMSDAHKATYDRLKAFVDTYKDSNVGYWQRNTVGAQIEANLQAATTLRRNVRAAARREAEELEEQRLAEEQRIVDLQTAHREKQLAANAQKRAQEKAQKQASAQAKEKARERRETARRQKGVAQQEIEAANRLEKERLREERAAAEEVRKADVAAEGAQFVQNGLNATKANEIVTTAQDRAGTNVNTVRGRLQAAFDTQMNPPLERWLFKLGAPRVYAPIRADESGTVFPVSPAGNPVHISFDQTCITAAPGSIGGHTAAQLLHALLLSPTRDFRIHATEENTNPSNHYFYGDAVGQNRPDKEHLRNVLTAYINSDLLPRVEDAIARHGDI